MIDDKSSFTFDTNQYEQRRPASGSARIEPLNILPLFFKLQDRAVLVWGANEGLVWKVELLASAGAIIYLVTDNPDLFTSLCAQWPRQITVYNRNWCADDFINKIFALGDCDDENEAMLFCQAAKKINVLVNIVDKPKLCDFQFGAIVNRSPLVIGLSTDGAAPVFGQTLRAKIEALIPYSFQKWAQVAQNWRMELQKLTLSYRLRRSFWERFTAFALDNPDYNPSLADRDAIISATLNNETSLKQGRVSLVGSGPGDPELLTLKAVRLLQSADVILYDDLVSPQIVAMGRREAERITVGKRGYKPSCTQGDISSLLVELARAGKHVVRLKGGDPMIFGRAGEEITAVIQAGFFVDIVPGVTAASGAAASLKTSLTHRGYARRLQFITAHAKGGILPEDLDWHALADKNATTVIYMGVATLNLLVQRLLAEGLESDTPAVIVEHATLKTEKIVITTLASLPQRLKEIAPIGPCVTIIGSAMAKVPQSVLTSFL